MAEYIFKEAERSSYLTADTNEIITTLEKKERIVRCRNCKHYVLDWEIDEERKCCTRLSKPLDEPFFPGDNGFCAWGEPRD